MTSQITQTSIIVIQQCCECGINFGIPESFKNTLLGNGETFYCPNGHSQYFANKKSLEDKLKIKERELKEERDFSSRLYDEKEDFKKKAAAQKGQKTKILNRIKNGVCPHCNKSFENLHDHMKSKHKTKILKKELTELV